MSLRGDIEAFFKAYMTAYLRLDAEGFAPFFDLPCLISDSAGDHVISGGADLAAYERPFIERLRADGLAAIDREIIRLEDLGDGDCTCSLRYRIKAREDRLIGDMEYHYFLRRTDAGWRIKFARIGRIHAWSESDIWQE